MLCRTLNCHARVQSPAMSTLLMYSYYVLFISSYNNNLRTMGKRVIRRADKKNLITRKFLRLIILIFALSNEKKKSRLSCTQYIMIPPRLIF